MKYLDILKTLIEGPKTTKELMKIFSLSEYSIQHAIQRARANGADIKYSHGHYHYLRPSKNTEAILNLLKTYKSEGISTDEIAKKIDSTKSQISATISYLRDHHNHQIAYIDNKYFYGIAYKTKPLPKNIPNNRNLKETLLNEISNAGQKGIPTQYLSTKYNLPHNNLMNHLQELKNNGYIIGILPERAFIATLCSPKPDTIIDLLPTPDKELYIEHLKKAHYHAQSAQAIIEAFNLYGRALAPLSTLTNTNKTLNLDPQVPPTK